MRGSVCLGTCCLCLFLRRCEFLRAYCVRIRVCTDLYSSGRIDDEAFICVRTCVTVNSFLSAA